MKVLRILLISFVLGSFLMVSVNAAEVDFYELSGAEALIEALPEETRSFMASFDLSPENIEPDTVTKILDAIRTAVLDEVDSPLQVFVKLISVLLITRLILEIAPSEIHHTVSFCQVLCLGIILIPKIIELIERTTHMLLALNGFLVAAVPVYGTIISLSGNPVTGSTYGALTLAAANGISVLQTQLILPLTRIFLAFTVVSSITESKLQQLTQTLYRTIKWILTTAVTLFAGIISLQSFLSSQADAVTGKTVKMIASSAIPIVGGAFGDALSVLSTGVTTMKSGIGAFGILATTLIFLPLCVRLAIWILIGETLIFAADLFSVSHADTFLNGCVTVLKTLLAILFSAGAAAIISAAILLCVRNAYG